MADTLKTKTISQLDNADSLSEDDLLFVSKPEPGSSAGWKSYKSKVSALKAHILASDTIASLQAAASTKCIPKSDVTQELGESQEKVPSQNLLSSEIAKLYAALALSQGSDATDCIPKSDIVQVLGNDPLKVPSQALLSTELSCIEASIAKVNADVAAVVGKVTAVEGQLGQLNVSEVSVFIAPKEDYYKQNGYTSHTDSSGRTYFTKAGLNTRYGSPNFYPGNNDNLELQYGHYGADSQRTYPVFSLNYAMQFIRRFRANGTLTYKVFCEAGVYEYADSQTIAHPDAVGTNSIVIEGVVNPNYADATKKMPTPADDGFSPFDLYLTQFQLEGTSTTGNNDKHPGKKVFSGPAIACSASPINVILKYVLIYADYDHISASPGVNLVLPNNSNMTLASCALVGSPIYSSGMQNPQITLQSIAFKSVDIDKYSVHDAPQRLYPVCFCSSKRYINLGGRNTIYGIACTNNSKVYFNSQTYIYLENLNRFIGISYGDIIMQTGSSAAAANDSNIRIDARLRTAGMQPFAIMPMFNTQYGKVMFQGSDTPGYPSKAISSAFMLNMYSSESSVKYQSLSSIAIPHKDGYDYTTGSTQNMFSRIIDSTVTHNGVHYVNGELPKQA